jgi:hypothetical protein
MTSEVDPIVESWYHYPEKAQKFFVSALDDHSRTVQVQYFDGAIGEFTLDEWYEFDIERIEAPEDWTGPMDNIEKDDVTSVGTEMSRDDWDAPFNELGEKRRAGPRVPDEWEEEPVDDWSEGRPEEEPLEDE